VRLPEDEVMLDKLASVDFVGVAVGVAVGFFVVGYGVGEGVG